MKKLAVISFMFCTLACSREKISEELLYEQKVKENYASIEKLVSKPGIYKVEFCEIDPKDGHRKMILAKTLFSCLNTDIQLNQPYIITKDTSFHAYSWRGYSFDGATEITKMYFSKED